MVNHAKSDELKHLLARKRKDNLVAQAVALYHAESNKKPGKKPMSLQMVCKSVSDDYFARTKIHVPLDHKTLLRLASGGITLTESNSKKSWLTKEENEVIVQFTIDMACHRFPLSPKCLREHAECILRHCLGDIFPDTGLGKNWATHFITRHHGRVGVMNSPPSLTMPSLFILPHIMHFSGFIYHYFLLLSVLLVLFIYDSLTSFPLSLTHPCFS